MPDETIAVEFSRELDERLRPLFPGVRTTSGRVHAAVQEMLSRRAEADNAVSRETANDDKQSDE